MYPSEKQTLPIETVLAALVDLSKPFPPVYLNRLSDLDSYDTLALKNLWSQISVVRRQALLEDLDDLTEIDTLVSFDEVGKIALKDVDAHVRSLAIRLVWNSQDIRLIPILIGMMKNDLDVEVRSTAAAALGNYVYLGELEEIPAVKLKTIEDNLLEVLKSQDHPLIRRRALESLGFSSRPEIPNLIQEAFNRGEVEWLESSLFAMGRSADDSWELAVTSQLTNPNDTIQLEAIQAAGELELASARATLFQVIEDQEGLEHDDIWEAAIWALSQIGGEGVREMLIKLQENAESMEETEILEDALDNLTFTEDKILDDLLDIDLMDFETDILDSDGNPVDEDLPEEPQSKKRKHKKSD
jgi:HEAT repeat protein